MIVDVGKIQQQSLDIIFSSQEGQPYKNDLLERIAGLPDGVVEIILGNFGKKLRAFSKVVDLEHPDLEKILGSSTRLLDSAIKLSQHLAENDYSCLSAEFPKLLPQQILKDLSSVDDPAKNQQCIRLLKSEEQRSKLRKNKKMQPIQFGHATKKGDIIWNNQTANFDVYIAQSKSYKNECEKIKKKAERYKKLACDFLYQEMLKGVDEYENQFLDNHYGFYRITMTSAALIIAKMHGYICEDLPEMSGFTIHKKKINGYQIFCPIVLPLHEAKKYPKRMVEVIDYLEHFPAANGKSIFDHYIILMPSFAEVQTGKYGALKPLESPLFWDMLGDEFIPVLMGEKDGKCYFICFYY